MLLLLLLGGYWTISLPNPLRIYPIINVTAFAFLKSFQNLLIPNKRLFSVSEVLLSV
jgi:hypothetical protein